MRFLLVVFVAGLLLFAGDSRAEVPCFRLLIGHTLLGQNRYEVHCNNADGSTRIVAESRGGVSRDEADRLVDKEHDRQ